MMNKKKLLVIEGDAKFSDRIYETPDDWGETTVTDEAEMEVVIKNLRKLGEDWSSCSLGDCQEYEFVKTINNAALYKRLHVRRSEYRLYKKHELDQKYYEYVSQIFASSDDEAIAEAEE